jgi:predicted Zn finger-like uncharacterized protein
MIRSKCPHCEKALRVSDDRLAGRIVSCPACKQKFKLEATADADVIVAELDDEPTTTPAKRRAVLATAETAEDDDNERRPKKKHKKHKKKKGDDDAMMAMRNRIVGGVAMLVGMGLIIAGLGEYLPQGAVDAVGVDACKYIAAGFGGLLTAVGVVYVIRG